MGAGSVLRFDVNGNLRTRIDGAAARVFLGWSVVANAASILVSTPFSTELSKPMAGAVYKYSGSGTFGWKISGTSVRQQLGYSVAGGVPLNAAAGVDWLVGSPGTDQAFVVSDAGQMVSTLESFMPRQPHFFGGVVRTPGDFDGDGYFESAIGIVDSAMQSQSVRWGPIDQGGESSFSAEEPSSSTESAEAESALECVEYDAVGFDCDVYDCASW